MDVLDFLDDEDPTAAAPAASAPASEDPASAPAPEPEPVAPAPASPDPAPAPADPAPASAAADPAAPAPAEVVRDKPEPGFVPVAVLREERERARAAESELATLKASQPQQTPPAAQEPAPPPDRYEDPEGYEVWRENQINQRFAEAERQRFGDRLTFSERLAVKEHGKEAVEQARAWALEHLKVNPGLKQAFQRHPDPIEFIVGQHRQSLVLQAVQDPSEFEQFQQWKRDRAAAAANPGDPAPAAPPAAAAPAAPAAPPQPSAPPRSIVHASNAGGKAGEEPVGGPGSAFDAAFTR